MAAELLFFFILIIILVLNTKFHVLNTSPVYLCWLLMSISVFNYTPSVLQYGFRAIAMAISLIVVLSGRRPIVIYKKGALAIFTVYTLFCLISTAWSVDKVQSFVKACELLVSILLVNSAIKRDGVEKAIGELLNTLWKMCVILVVYLAIGSVLLRSTFITVIRGVLGMHLTGGIMSADTTGCVCVFVIIGLLIKPKFKFKMLLGVLVCGELFLCQARTSLVSFCLIVIVYAVRTKKKWLYAVVAVIVLVGAYYNKELIMQYFMRGTDANNMQTMSGRTVMWASAKLMINERPLLGYGFGSGGELISKLNNGMTSLHSGIYECLMGVGYVGLSFVVLSYIYVCIALVVRCFRFGLQRNSMEIMLLIDLTIRTYMSTGIGGWHSHVLMIWFVFAAAMSANMRNTLSDSFVYDFE